MMIRPIIEDKIAIEMYKEFIREFITYRSMYMMPIVHSVDTLTNMQGPTKEQIYLTHWIKKTN